MRTILYSNMIPFFSLLLLLLLVHYNPLFEKKQGNLFRFTIYLCLFILVAISLDYLFQSDLSNLPNAWIYRSVTTFINFAATPLIPILLYKIFSGRKCTFWHYVPCIFNILLCFASMFFRLVFDISPANTYDRGGFFFVPFGIMIFYMILLILRLATFHSHHRKNEQLFLVFVIIALIVCLYMEIVHHFKFLSWDVATLSIVMYYLLININNATYDPLTGAYNRALYMKKLSEIDDSSCIIALLDINDFKKINDEQGHDAGDRALMLFVQRIHETMDKGAELYRIGGDEFAVLASKWTKSRMDEFIKAAQAKVRMEKLSFACGIMEYIPGGDIDETIRLADKNMYINKSEMKRTPLA